MNNSLAEVHPELITEWSEKNLPLTPDDITFFYGKSFREIGKEEGVNHSVISRSVKAGIEKIKKSF